VHRMTTQTRSGPTYRALQRPSASHPRSVHRIFGWITPQDFSDSVLVAHRLPGGTRGEVRGDQRIHDRTVFELELGKLQLEITFGGFEARPRMVRDKIDDPTRVSLGTQVASTVKGMEAGVDEFGGVPDIMQPGCSDQDRTVLRRHHTGQAGRDPGHGLNMCPPSPERSHQTLSQLR